MAAPTPTAGASTTASTASATLPQLPALASSPAKAAPARGKKRKAASKAKAKTSAQAADGAEGDAAADADAVVEEDESADEGTAKPKKKAKRVKDIVAKNRTWKDLDAILKKYPNNDRPDRPLENLPIDCLDRILGNGSLTLRDHLALSGTNRALRQLYTEDIWAALLLDRAQYSYFDLAVEYNGRKLPNILRTIASTGGQISAPAPVAESSDKPAGTGEAGPSAPRKYDRAAALLQTYDYVRGGYSAKPVAKTDDAHVQRDRVIAHVNERRIVKTTARSEYKVTEAELKSLKHVVTRGMMGRQSLLYRVSAVEALALRAHGGPDGHAAHVKKLRATAEKAKATRVKNGTVQTRKPRAYANYGAQFAEMLALLGGGGGHYNDFFDEFGYDDDGMTFEGDEAFYDGYGHDF